MSDRIRHLTESDLPRLKEFWTEQWGAEIILAHHEVVRYDQVEGYLYDDWEGLITYLVRGDECEITSLNSLMPGAGIGTALLNELVREARRRMWQRVFLITTNDNLQALGFYQRFGFELVAVHRGAVNESRKVKPSIPLIGENGIPLRDEIELELLI